MPPTRNTTEVQRTQKGKGGPKLTIPTGTAGNSPFPASLDDDSELSPNSEAANKAMRCIEEIYGTNHFLTKNAHREFLRIRAEEEAGSTVPFHEQLRSLGLKLHQMESDLASHVALVHQAEATHRKATTRLADLTTTTADITDQIHTIQAQKDLLVANYTPDHSSQKAHTNKAGLAELMFFLDKANDTEDPDNMAWIRKEIVEFTRQFHMGTQISDSSDMAGWDDLSTYGPSFFTGTHGPSKESKSVSQAHTDHAQAQHQDAVHELTEANAQTYQPNRHSPKPLAFHKTYQTIYHYGRPCSPRHKQQQTLIRPNCGPLGKKGPLSFYSRHSPIPTGQDLTGVVVGRTGPSTTPTVDYRPWPIYPP
jgi:hypothetical protein